MDIAGHEELKQSHLKLIARNAAILCENIGLEFGALDFVLDKAACPYMVDVNPTPGWGFEKQDTILDFLRDGYSELGSGIAVLMADGSVTDRCAVCLQQCFDNSEASASMISGLRGDARHKKLALEVFVNTWPGVPDVYPNERLS